MILDCIFYGKKMGIKEAKKILTLTQTSFARKFIEIAFAEYWNANFKSRHAKLFSFFPVVAFYYMRCKEFAFMKARFQVFFSIQYWNEDGPFWQSYRGHYLQTFNPHYDILEAIMLLFFSWSSSLEFEPLNYGLHVTVFYLPKILFYCIQFVISRKFFKCVWVQKHFKKFDSHTEA